jgi:hypothetical protein
MYVGYWNHQCKTEEEEKNALWDTEVTVDMILVKAVHCRGYVEPWGRSGNQIRYQSIERTGDDINIWEGRQQNAIITNG